MKNKFEHGHHTIFQGDAVQILRENIAEKSIDLIFVDPPYNIGKRFGDFEDKWISDVAYVEWCKVWLDLCLEKLTDHGSMYVMTSTQAMPYLDLYLRSKAQILSRIVWKYDSSGMQAKKYYGSMYEPLLFCVKDKNEYVFNANDISVEAKTGAQRKLIDYRKAVPAPYNTRKVPGNVWEFSRVRYRMDEYEKHPSQKPEALLERVILASSNEGDKILDPFSGTFTTSAVAKRHGRKSIGIESNSEYVDIGLRRVLGFMEMDGRNLTAPRKSTKQKNRNGIKNALIDEAVRELFDADI